MYTPNYMTDFYGYSTRPCLTTADFKPYTGVDQFDPYTFEGYIDFDSLRNIPDYGLHADIPATVYTLHRRELTSLHPSTNDAFHTEVMQFLSDMHTILVSYQPYSDTEWASDEGYQHYSLALNAVGAYLSVYLNYRINNADITDLIRAIMRTFNDQLKAHNLTKRHAYYTRELSQNEGVDIITSAFTVSNN